VKFLVIDIDLCKYDLPNTYRRNGSDCFLDPIRRKLIQVTQEETVRQKIIQFLIKEINVPPNYIGVEVPLSEVEKGAKGRADIVVYADNGDSNAVPVLIVECKAQSIELTHSVYKQVVDYDSVFRTGIIAVTNGHQIHFQMYNLEKDAYINLKKIPLYKDLIQNENIELDYTPPEIVQWPNYEELFEKEVIEEFEYEGAIGEDTENYLKPFIINMISCLFNESIKFPKKTLYGVNIVEDGGLRISSYGNAGGGHFSGIYRYLIIKDSNDNNQIVSFSIMATAKTISDPIYGNRMGRTVLIVAIDDYEKSHNSLQLSLDNFVACNGTNFIVWHNGRMAIGNRGSAKISDFIKFIKAKAPELLNKVQSMN